MARTRTLTVTLPLAALLAAAAFSFWQWRRPRPDLAGWNQAKLVAEMEALGYRYHSEPRDRVTSLGRRALAGTYFWRDGAATTWEEAAAQPARLAGRWRGLVVARRSAPGFVAEPSPEVLQIGPWVVLGDPYELDRIALALGLR
jgi:hypothetical protein